MAVTRDKRQGGRWPWLVLSLMGLVAAGLIATRSQTEPLVIQERAWRVAVVAAEPQTLAPRLTLYGRLESLWSSQLSAPVAAEVLGVVVSEGELVRRNQVLIRLDERDSRLRLQQRDAGVRDARARLESEQHRHATDRKVLEHERRLLKLQQAEVNRLRDLLRKQVGAQSALDNARQAVERQVIRVAQREQAIAEHPARQAQLEAALVRAGAVRDQARLELERCTMRAPFDGRVARMSTAPGHRTRIGEPLLTIYDTGAMVVRALIPERYLPKVRAAMAMGSPPGVRGELDGIVLNGRLRGLNGEVTAGSGGVSGLFDIQGDIGVLRHGRFLRLDMILPAEHDVVVLPHEAVYGVDKIYIVDRESRMRPVRVERLGEMRGDDGSTRMLVRSSRLRPGVRIVVTHLPNAVDGLLVRVAEGPGT